MRCFASRACQSMTAEPAHSHVDIKPFIVSQLVNPELARFLYSQIVSSGQSSGIGGTGGRPEQAISIQAHPVTEEISIQLLSRIENEVGALLYPAYSVLQIHGFGETTAAEAPKQDCDVTVDLTLVLEADSPWPLWISHHEISISFMATEADAVIFGGADLTYWRYEFNGG